MHLKSPISRTISIEPPPSTRSMTPPLGPVLQGSASSNQPLTGSSTTSPSGKHTPTGQVPQPKAHGVIGNRTRAMSSETANPQSPRSPVRHPLLARAGSESGSPARPRITIDPAATPSHDHVPRPRANSITSQPQSATSDVSVRPHIAPMRRLTGEPAPAVHTDQADQPDLTLARARSGSTSGLAVGVGSGVSGLRSWGRTFTLHPDREAGEREDYRTKNPFTRFIHDIPNWLHRHHPSTADSEPEPDREVEVERDAPRRHMQGEVVCLHYGTIDDAGMRQLEGRS
jgi:hypothetical protein